MGAGPGWLGLGGSPLAQQKVSGDRTQGLMHARQAGAAVLPLPADGGTEKVLLLLSVNTSHEEL
jgi:hypothetical protein